MTNIFDTAKYILQKKARQCITVEYKKSELPTV